MRTLIPLVLLALSLVSAGSLLTGCAGKHVDENDPAALMKDAEEDIQDSHYQIAVDKLRIIKNKFPYSKYAIDAQLRLADVFFLQESYAEAALAYESFRDLHPKNERVPYAQFRIGLSYFNDTPGNVARDLTPAAKALEAFSDFIQRFPNTPEVPEAKQHIEQARTSLASKELYIANFYFKRDKFDSARTRYAKLIELYPETPQAKEAKENLRRAEQELAKEKEKEAPTHGASDGH